MTSMVQKLGCLMVALGLVGCAAEPGEETDVVASEEEIIFDSGDDWLNIDAFERSSTLHTAAFYGRAVGAVLIELPSGEQGQCSGFLISDHRLITAAHCREAAEDEWGAREAPDHVTAVFGRYGTASRPWLAGRSDLYARLRDLGIPPDRATTIRDDVIERGFSCEIERASAPQPGLRARDVDIYRCEPHRVLVELEGVWAAMELFPGHLFGHIELEQQPELPAVGESVLSISYNYEGTDDPAFESVRFSPNGEMWDRSESCLVDRAGSCFSTTGDDMANRSSGGVVLDGESFRALGLISGQREGVDARDRRPRPSHRERYRNVHTRLDGSDYWYSADPLLPSYEPLPSAAWYVPAAEWVGGTGGTYRSQQCESGEIAAGIVATTIDYGGTTGTHVGNLGIVCMPWSGAYQLDHAMVSMGSSLRHGAVSRREFNELINETTHRRMVDGTVSNRWEQMQLLMCPPGYWLGGIRTGSDGRLVDRIVSIECARKIDSSHRVTIAPREPIGGWNGGFQILESSSCREGYLVNGLFNRSGWYTDGFQVSCRNAH